MGVEVTLDEADKKRQEMLDRARNNPEYQRILAQRGQGDRSGLVTRKEDRHYRWVSKRRVEERKNQAFETVRPQDGEVTTVAGAPMPDNTIGLKEDLVLMSEPMDLHLLKREQDREKAAGRFKKKMEADREELNRKARNEGLVGPHQEAVVDRSREASDQEALTMAPGGEGGSRVVRRKLPS